MADFLFEIGLEEVPARMIAGAEAELRASATDVPEGRLNLRESRQFHFAEKEERQVNLFGAGPTDGASRDERREAIQLPAPADRQGRGRKSGDKETLG